MTSERVRDLIYEAIIFWLIAIVMSFIYGIKAFEIHGDTKGLKESKSNKWFRWHQFWLNFLGAFVGWSLLYYILAYRLDIFRNLLVLEDYRITSIDLIVLLFAFLGITGYLPYTVLIKDWKIWK